MREKYKNVLIEISAWSMVIGFIVLCWYLLAGCSPKVVTVERVKHDSIYITKHQRDSIWQHDSIYVKEYSKGDTVFVEVTKWVDRYKELLKVDTAYIERIDSIPVPYPIEKKTTLWQKSQYCLTGAGIVVVLAIIAWISKLLYKRE